MDLLGGTVRDLTKEVHVQKSVLLCSVLLIAGLSGCAVSQDGAMTLGMKGSPVWVARAPAGEVDAYFDAMQLHELCIQWKTNPDYPKTLSAISRSLQRRNIDPLHCYRA